MRAPSDDEYDEYDAHAFDEFAMPSGVEADRFFGIGTSEALASPQAQSRKQQRNLSKQREHVVAAEREVSKRTAAEMRMKDDHSRLLGAKSAAAKEVRLLERKVQSLESMLTRQQRAARKGREAARVLQQRLSKAQADDKRRREQSVVATKEESEQAARLDAALEELENVKAALREERGASRAESSDVGRQLDEAQTAMLRLRKERATLLAAFQKQGALIAALKQQKLHVEAATLLQITRDEFVAATTATGGARAKGKGRGRGRSGGRVAMRGGSR
jgi:chromosome segregation ATPase|tara:strand:- start:2593 stop:3420 length:828 start_codon:yes stop_codon:yes gene_type:complete